MVKLLLLSFLLGAPALAYADCGKLAPDHVVALPKWAQALVPGKKEGMAFEPACKRWPANPAITLVAFSVVPKNSGRIVYSGDMLVAAVDTKTGAVVAHLLEPKAYTNVFKYLHIAVDTVRYQLTETQVAFGVRVDDQNEFGEPRGAEVLYLYVLEGNVIRRVLNRLIVAGRDDGMREQPGSCQAGVDLETISTINIGDPGMDGYASLRVAENKVCGYDVLRTGAIVRRSVTTLNYANGEYALPKFLANYNGRKVDQGPAESKIVD